jgi:TetR/AcrR family transcriptional repressor of mexJK operon
LASKGEMSLSETRRPSPDERRAAILEIAREVFLEEGYAAGSMSRIAAEVGGSKATLYSYFPSKRELFVAVIEREADRLFDQIFSTKPSPGEPLKAIDELVRRSVTALLSDRIVKGYRLIIAEAGRFPDISKASYQLAVQRGLERLALYFARAMLDGVLRPCDSMRAAESFLDLAAGSLHTQRLWNAIDTASPEQIDREVRRITAVFLGAYGNDELSRIARERDRSQVHS